MSICFIASSLKEEIQFHCLLAHKYGIKHTGMRKIFQYSNVDSLYEEL